MLTVVLGQLISNTATVLIMVPIATVLAADLHVSVLPWWGGSHSGWVELCRDAGTRAVVPAGGWQGQQWSDVVLYGNDPQAGLDGASLTSAVVAALTRPAPGRVDHTWRSEQRAAVRRVHAQVYEQVAADHVPA